MKVNKLDNAAFKFTHWVGSISSLIVHTIIFVVSFLLGILGVPWDSILLILTTIVSLEAIYLAIFIQMSVNRNTQSLALVEEDIDEIQGDVDEIQEDIDEIQEDVGEISEEDKEKARQEQEGKVSLEKVSADLVKLMADFEKLRSIDRKNGGV